MSELRTYQTKLNVTEEQDKILSQYAEIYGKVKRKLFAAIQANNKSINQIKREFLRKFDITSRQFNAIRIEVEANISALKELRDLRIDSLKRKISTIKEVIPNIEDGFKQHNKKRKLYNLQSKLEKLQKDKENNTTRICFGSKKLFYAQYFLEENKLSSHEEWYTKWKDSRNSQFYLVGSKDETGGNNSCVATLEDNNSLTLRIRLPNSLGKYLTLKNIRFNHGQDIINETIRKNTYDKPNSIAVSYRFIKENNKWYLHLSTTLVKPKTISIWGSGVVGVDLNVDRLSVSETDRFGNIVNSFDISCDTRYKNANQRKAVIGDAIKELIRYTTSVKKEIVIEDLDFSKKKNQADKFNKRHNRILSSFAYSFTKNNLKARAFDAGITVREVNPAYTSVIGFHKFSKRYGISRHQAAALCIARRYQRFSESLPSQLHNTLSESARKRSRHIWSKWAEVLRKSQTVPAAPKKSKRVKSPRSSLTPKETSVVSSRLKVRSTSSDKAEILMVNRSQNCSENVASNTTVGSV